MVSLVVGSHLLQIIFSSVEIVLFAGGPDPSAQREIHGPKNFRGRIGLLDHCGVLLAQGNDCVVIGLIWFDVAMRVAPAARFIVELIVRNAPVRGRAECRNQMLQPALLERNGIVDVIGIDIVVQELRTARRDTVAAIVAIGMHVGIGRLLRAIYRNGETAVPLRCFVYVRNNRNRQQRVRV